jgi:hypothetical protein
VVSQDFFSPLDIKNICSIISIPNEIASEVRDDHSNMSELRIFVSDLGEEMERTGDPLLVTSSEP